MKVIEFPKTIIEDNKRNNKFRIAFKLLKMLVDNRADFHIIIDKKDSLLLLDEKEFGDKREYLIITSDLEKARKLIIENKNSCIFPIQGDEF